MVHRRRVGTRNPVTAVWSLVMTALLVVVAAQSGSAQTYTTLYTFGAIPDGDLPESGVVKDSLGNLYGTTVYGGTATLGTVFKVDTHGNETILYNFKGAPDGGVPMAPVLLDPAGRLFGVTFGGGAFGYGTVYELTKLGVETVLYSFKGIDGDAYPLGSLIRDSAGNFYGITGNNGGGPCSANCGTVFKLAPDGTESILHTFSGTSGDGAYPQGLVRDKKGNFYGFTWSGGDLACDKGSGCGVVFKIDTTGKETILYTFEGGSFGEQPIGAPILDSTGNIYGATVYGGNIGCVNGGGFGCGTVFKFSAAGEETILHTFGGGADGALPYGGLVRDSSGNLYGYTVEGGNQSCWNNYGCGVFFKINPVGKEHTFDIPEWQIAGPLTRDSSGNLYGTTPGGGFSIGYGTVFKLTP